MHLPAGAPALSRLQHAARGALALLALALPFELVAPLARIGPLQLTSVELFLYLALALSAAAIAARVLPAWRALPWRRLAIRHAGVALFAVVLLVSALRAPLARPDAIKFALRSGGGIALYVAAANLLRAPAAALTTGAAMTLGGVVAAALMWAELRLPGAAAALRPFHARTFDVYGLPRASGPFQYPNIAAMYLEAVLPLALAAGAGLAIRRGARPGTGAATTALTLAAALVIAAGLALTASRAALLTSAVVLAALAAHGLHRRTPGRWQAPAALVVLALFALTNSAFGSLAGVRLAFWSDQVWYRSAIAPATALPAALVPAGMSTLQIDVRNSGVRPWPAAGPQPVVLRHRWHPGAGARAGTVGAPTRLPRDIAPGETIRLAPTIVAPAEPGRYQLHLEMVHEGITPFGEQGDAGYAAIVDVRPAPATAEGAADARRAAPTAAAPAPPAATPDRATRVMLWRAAVMAWKDHPLLGLGPDNFRHAYNRYLGVAHPDERLHANSLYLETLASLGLAGVVALALTIAGFAGAARRALLRHGAAAPAGLLAAAAAAGLFAYLVHGCFDYFLEFTPTYALFWLLGGMLSGLASEGAAG